MKRIFLLLLAAVAVTACGASRRVSKEPANPWVGYTTPDILTRMGGPTRIDETLNGGSILVYEFSPDYTSPDFDILDPQETVREQGYAHFYLDEEGYCFRVDTNRDLPAPPNNPPAMVRRAIWLDALIWVPILFIGFVI